MEAPHRVGESFTLSVTDAARAAGLTDDGPTKNYREDGAPDPELEELAASLAAVGQLQAVGMVWSEDRYVLAFGFRRVSALWRFGDRRKGSVRCERVPEENSDLARLVENLGRKDPTSYETARYFYELHYGLRGRRRTVAELAIATGKNGQTIRNLVRFYRVLPVEVREAWRADRDQHFSFRTLARIVMEVQEGKAPADILGPILGLPGDEPRAELAPAEGDETAPPADPECEFCGGEGERFGHTPDCRHPATCTLSGRPEDCDGAIQPCPCIERRKAREASDGKPETEPAVSFGRRVAGRYAKRLAAAGERLRTDDRAPLVLDVLQVAAGKLPVSRIEEIVSMLLIDLGVEKGGGRAA